MVENYPNCNDFNALFFLFSLSICNCVAGFVSSCMTAFKLQMVAQTPETVAAPSNYYLGPWIRDLQYED